MKQCETQLEQPWRNSKSKEDPKCVRAHNWVSAMAFLPLTPLGQQSHNWHSFSRWLVAGFHILVQWHAVTILPCTLMIKMNQIQMDLESGLQIQSLAKLRARSGPVLWDEFKLTSPEDANRTLGGIWPTSSILKPCLSWMVEADRTGLQDCLCHTRNVSLKCGHLPVQ